MEPGPGGGAWPEGCSLALEVEPGRGWGAGGTQPSDLVSLDALAGFPPTFLPPGTADTLLLSFLRSPGFREVGSLSLVLVLVMAFASWAELGTEQALSHCLQINGVGLGGSREKRRKSDNSSTFSLMTGDSC